MTEPSIQARYDRIVDGLDPADIDRLWMNVLVGRRNDDPRIAARAKDLDQLRLEVGLASAARSAEVK